ncbi:hypothetical protein NFI96_009296 [Prochilodus magdalenae]|nr:hypothetical protein NFI96_009296 [Prochilodus magdalenae]
MDIVTHIEMKRIVQLDLDLKYKSNIRDLFQEFRHFPPDAVIGIVREMQPVYRCRARLRWSDSEWQRVVFSDESRFGLGGDDQRIRVWRHRGQHQDERHLLHVQKA